MASDGVEALDEQVVTRRHVAISCPSVSCVRRSTKEDLYYMAWKSNIFVKSPGGMSSIEKQC